MSGENTSGMMVLMFVVACIIYLFSNTPATTFNVTEIICKPGGAEYHTVDERHNCKEISGAASDLEFKVNPLNQKVQLSVIHDSGNWGLGNFILDNCTVVDAENWKCGKEGIGDKIGSIHAMWHGRYYYSVTGGPPPDAYHSSIGGISRLAYRWGLINLKTAVELSN